MLFAVTLTLAGCTLWDRSGAADQPTAPFTGLTKDLRIRWTAEPGIDLLTGPAVIVRAYRESYILAGLMASPALYYPGFERAVPPNDNGRNSLIRPPVAGDKYLNVDGFQTTTPIVGTWRQHILSVTGNHKAGYTVKMCDWDYATATLQSSGQYRYPHRNPPQPLDTADPITGVQIYRISLVRRRRDPIPRRRCNEAVPPTPVSTYLAHGPYAPVSFCTQCPKTASPMCGRRMSTTGNGRCARTRRQIRSRSVVPICSASIREITTQRFLPSPAGPPMEGDKRDDRHAP
ncbi:hypothetical protein I540_1225 [Mycobacteroides abscessus subsp. bolletii 1513]|uniref:Uncharacterized protein n=1 Tax=Mycobacteroides abscessus subsp. bolletii 1513 TaxID=1299321 RepID=X8DPJ9_9MYCO|nr:hypothetical protein I540_1225 [Mycobacteroides abscessus subsp. bolletii 1513]